MVEIECAQCVGPVTKGIKIAYKMNTLLAKQPLTPGSKKFTIPLLETGGWVIDPQNTLITSWKAPTKCQFIQVLSAISSINILGDWTQWYETVALDNIQFITNTKLASTADNQNAGMYYNMFVCVCYMFIILYTGTIIPLCAMAKPDASVCTC